MAKACEGAVEEGAYMNLDHKIIGARPNDTQAKTLFTDAVMKRVTKRRKNRLWRLLQTSPVFAVLAGLFMLMLVSSTVYAAVTYLWPRTHITVTKPSTTTSGRQEVQVFSNDCPDIANKRYELKKVAPFGPDKIADVVKAECNIEAIYKWVRATHPDAFSSSSRAMALDSTPGKVFPDQKSINYPAAYKIQSVSATSVTFAAKDQWNPAVTSAYTADTKFIINHQYGKWSDFHPGDAVTYITMTTSTFKNGDDCTSRHCSSMPVSSKEELLAVVKLDMPFEDYDKFGSLSEVVPCQDNEKDDCHTGNISGIEIWRPTSMVSDDTQSTGIIEGVVQSHTKTATIIKTTSRRLVTLSTAYDPLQSFNNSRSADYNGTTVAVGDLIQVMYFHAKGTITETIHQQNIMSIMLITEINSRADLTGDTAPPKY